MDTRLLILISVLAINGLAGCTPTRVNGHVPVAISTHFQNAPSSQDNTSSTDLQSWWKHFQDPVLDDLISRALAANHDLKIAKARVREARTVVTVTESALYPTIDLFSSGGREKRIDRIIGLPTNQGIQLVTPIADVITGGLTARWEIDIFGGRHLEVEASIAQAEGIEAALNAVQVSLLAQIATDYMNLRGIQGRLITLRKSIEVQRERLRTLELFARAGLINERDVSRQKTAVHDIEGLVPLLVNAEATRIHRLGVLVGIPPSGLKDQLTQPVPLPTAMPSIPNLLPSSLLAQRPDLHLAQTEVTAMAASLGVARANLLPKLVLSASGGIGALAVGGFSSLAESVYALGSGLTAPIFNAGRIRAHIAGVEAQLDQSARNYEKTFLIALEDVENAFVFHTSALERHEHLAKAETAAEKTHGMANALYQRGVHDYLSVLDAHLARLSTNDEITKARTEVLVSMVSLYRAFGGGWNEKTAPEMPR